MNLVCQTCMSLNSTADGTADYNRALSAFDKKVAAFSDQLFESEAQTHPWSTS